jgi:tRNA pseudouridine55 synthase
MTSPTGSHGISSGALLIDKPAGITSFGVVGQIRHALAEAGGLEKKKGLKVGHGGTLDPFATGLLVVLIGRGSRLAEYYLQGRKGYQATAQFGTKTASGDLSTEVTSTTDTLPESIEALRGATEPFLGVEYLQTPPMYSAIKVKGKRLYKLAMQGKTVQRPPRRCRIYDFTVSEWNSPLATFEVCVSSGTYIRTLAEDWAVRLDSLASLKDLRRTRSGDFDVADAMTLDDALRWIKEQGSLTEASAFIPFDRLLGGPTFGKVDLTDRESHALIVGQQNEVYQRLHASSDVDPRISISGLYFEGRLSGVIRRKGESPWQIERVFVDRIKDQEV